jgi:hypothetical protein
MEKLLARNVRKEENEPQFVAELPRFQQIGADGPRDEE